MADTQDMATISIAEGSLQVWQRAFPTGYWKEFKHIMKIAWALILTAMSQVGFQPVATMFGGHLGKLELEAIALSNTLINILGNSMVIGFSSCLETVFSQSYGVKNYRMYGIFLQKGLILHLMLLMPCYAIYMNILPILLALGQPKAVSELTAQYLLYFMPGLFFLFMWTVLRKFTECQNQVAPHNVIALIAHIVHALLQYLILYQFKFGILGSSIVQAITFFLLFTMTFIYTLCSKAFKSSWFGWDRRCLLSWGALASLGIFGMLMMCLEWWAIAISLFVAGVIGGTELAAQTVVLNLFNLFYGLIGGIASATGIRVGQYLGAGDTTAAITSARVGLSLSVFNGLGVLILFIALRSELPKIFTNDSEVIAMACLILPLVAIYQLGDAISNIGRAIFRGTGRQLWGTLIIFIAFYVMALPISLPLAFVAKMDLQGIWIGYAVALIISAIIYIFVIIYGLNWNLLAEEAAVRAKGDIDDTEHDNEEIGEKTGLIVSEKIEIPLSLYITRAATVTFFLLIPTGGLVVRLCTTREVQQTVIAAVNSTSHGGNLTSYHLLP